MVLEELSKVLCTFSLFFSHKFSETGFADLGPLSQPGTEYPDLRQPSNTLFVQVSQKLASASVSPVIRPSRQGSLRQLSLARPQHRPHYCTPPFVLDFASLRRAD